ncbi:zinc finger CCCH domain-containing protein 34-like isoform X2 [Dioscorea cayenensis subsp. rotundata]|uniref:Zinc finger CCCH domain-containing protein 34-like isoform X2 n=1 Tax=Dioscorea cayennensis subsp. rotundata TaxID=55577 RepID=A0AB40BGS6_DIOCR|nr:zinc finger CCCH domain-containing protein 34-like isoform X2 [Dioscorea cayenensis subsp. rotundata]
MEAFLSVAQSTLSFALRGRSNPSSHAKMADFVSEPTLTTAAPSPEAINAGLKDLCLDKKTQQEPEDVIGDQEDNEPEDEDGKPDHGDDGDDGDDDAEEEELEEQEEPVLAKEEGGKKFRYPVRPGEPACSYYIKTGTCRFGSNCKYNHPRRRRRTLTKDSLEANHQAVKEKEREIGKETLPEKAGHGKCKYFLMPGGCKFGKDCKFAHDQEMNEEGSVELNFLGLPVRPGARECSYYMRTGGCKYANNCKFHHPDPIAVGGREPRDHPSKYNQGHTPVVSQLPATSWPMQIGSNEPVTFLNPSPHFMPGMILPPQGLHPTPEWNGFQAPVNPFYLQPAPPPPHPEMFVQYAPPNPVHQQVYIDEFPDRPGQPECQHFMKTGSCKFKSSCKFHHPKSRSVKASPSMHAA